MKSHLRFAILAFLTAAMPVVASAQTQLAKQQQMEAGEQAPAEGLGELTPGQISAYAKGERTDTIMVREWKNPKEQRAYTIFYKIPASNPQGVIRSGESFLKSYPLSVYASSVYARLARAYEVTGDSAKMLDAGHKALALDPNDVDVLSLLAYTIPRRIDPSNISAGSQLQEATRDASNALDFLSKIQKPAGLTPTQFSAAVSGDEALCHSGLGLIDYYQHNIPGMVSEFEQAVKLEPTPDPSDEYLLGMAYLQIGRPGDAVATLQKCATALGSVGYQCSTGLASAQKLVASPAKQQ